MSNIKIQDINQRVQYAATSSQTVFNVPFPFFENQDLQVYQNDTLLNIGTSAGEYGVTGAGSASGGVVTLVTGATSGDLITILGATPIDRTSIYSATISNLTGRDLNNDFNRDIVMLKQVWTVQNLLQLQYKPFLEVSQDIDVKRDRWLPILGASQVWAMNPAGTEIIAVDFDETASAPADARYFLAQADGGLINGVDFGALTSGLLKHSVSAGVSTPTTAIPATDYWAPGNDLTTPNPPVNGDDVTNKTYVDALVYGGIWFHSVRAASTANFASTYDNGSSGIGATLTASSNGAASLDGISLSLNDRALFKDQSNAFENGIYVVTQVGDGSNPAIYTRTTDFNEPSQIDPGDIIPATEGSTNNDTFWVQTSTVNTIGTDSIDFSLFGIKPANVVTISGAQTITGAKTFDANVALGNSATLTLNSSTSVDSILDEDNMVSDSATALATQQSIKAYVDSQAVFGDNPTFETVTFSPTTGGLVGTTTNDNADSGIVGEIISSQVLFASAVSLTSTVNRNITSISVPAGDWDISGIAFLSSSVSYVTCVSWINTVSATQPDQSLRTAFQENGVLFSAPIVTRRYSFNATTTVYLSCAAAFGSGIMTACGYIQARRIR